MYILYIYNNDQYPRADQCKHCKLYPSNIQNRELNTWIPNVTPITADSTTFSLLASFMLHMLQTVISQ